ncbi:MAG TPA: hypothetical protein VFU69_08080 [Ktedonobacterales bacterium]|nr:hypothetical protein [Ktedonobacterales bacterium]
MKILNKISRQRLILILTSCVVVITLLVGAQIFLRGAQAQGDTSPLAKPTIRCHKHDPCTYLASAGFSDTQGQNQWSYQFSLDQETTFADMTYDSTNTQWQGPEGGCLNSTDWQHPGFSLCDSVRTWVSPGAGSVTLSANGLISVASNCSGSTNTAGVQIRILLNGVQLWPATGWQVIPNGDTFSFPDVTTAVQAADQIQFVVAHVGSNNECDTTTWDQLVTLVTK